jgi:glycosyltransferase involved in cell wall biosynthesis
MLKYVIIADTDLQSGIIKKAGDQVSALNELGISSELIIISQVTEKEDTDHFSKYYCVKFEGNTFYSRWKRARRIRTIINNILKSLNYKDVFYYRGLEFIFWYYPISFFKPFRKCRVISEHQSIEINQSILYHSFVSFFHDLVFGTIIAGQSDGIIGVTEEITHYWKKRLFYRTIPHCTISNGIRVDSVIPRKTPPFLSENLNLLFVGNVSRWHGLDRMIQGMAHYKGSVVLQLHIAGQGDELADLRRLKDSISPSLNIHFHGFLDGKDLDAMYNACHIAVGSLGIHRKGLKKTSELKVREYCARGIPYIIACGDADFPDDFPWIFRVEADERPIDMEKVVIFAQSIFGGTDPAPLMRKYAEENLDWKVKIAQLKAFIENKILVSS